jgi:hypothetical protein
LPALSLRAHQLDPAFLWAPPAARAAVVAWALDVFIAQLAATVQLFEKTGRRLCRGRPGVLWDDTQ